MRLKLAAVLTAVLALSATASAQEARNVVVVELFTSQGCGSCPPADALMQELAERQDVIALALHVDYWDYIGWADTFAAPQYTQRQQGYGRAAGSTVVYTPQMIVGGQDHVVGFRPMQVANLIQTHQQTRPNPVEITVAESGDVVAVEASTNMPPPRPQMVVQIVSFSPHEQVEIARGERAGTTSNHYNVVTSWHIVGEWDGAGPFSAEIERNGDAPHVVIVQEAGYGRILGAVRLN